MGVCLIIDPTLSLLSPTHAPHPLTKMPIHQRKQRLLSPSLPPLLLLMLLLMIMMMLHRRRRR